MANRHNHSWWTLLGQGLLAIIFGVMVLVWPQVTLRTLILIFAAYAVIEGAVAVIGALMQRQQDNRRWLALLGGVVSVAVGLITFFWPQLTTLVLLYFIAARAIILGILQVVRAIQWHREIEGEWVLALGGLLSVIFGVVAFVLPSTGALALIWLIALYAIVTGITWVILALRTRVWRANESSSPD